MEPIKITKKQAAPILAKTFPDYTGRKFKVVFTDKLTFYNTNWCEGSRNYYAFVRADGATAHLYVPAPWVNPVEGKSEPLPDDILVVVHSIFCGQDCGITIYANPCHFPKWLPAQVAEN